MPYHRPHANLPPLSVNRNHPRRSLTVLPAATILGIFVYLSLPGILSVQPDPRALAEALVTPISPLKRSGPSPSAQATLSTTVGISGSNDPTSGRSIPLATTEDTAESRAPDLAPTLETRSDPETPDRATPLAASVSNPRPPADTLDTPESVTPKDPSPDTVDVAPSATSENQIRWITRKIRPGDTVSKIFADTGLDTASLDRALMDRQTAKQLSSIHAGHEVRILVGADSAFQSLEYDIDALRTFKVDAASDRITTTIEQAPAQRRIRIASGFIEGSLFESGQQAGLSDSVIMQLAELFRWDIDFALEIRSGDQYTVIYEQQWRDGRKIEDGEILAAEFVNRGRAYRAVRYATPDGKAAYYTPKGKPLRKTFLRTPVDFTRVSSGFSQSRWHPVLKERRAHKGVDYAAPKGTPVHAAGNGKVVFKGWKGGYGNLVILQHGEHYSTAYGHLSRFATELALEISVRQGQVIGYVGQTGLATGPHLHYEFRVDGVHRNPLNLKVPIAEPLPKKHLADFRRVAEPLLVQLDLLNRTLVAHAQ